MKVKLKIKLLTIVLTFAMIPSTYAGSEVADTVSNLTGLNDISDAFINSDKALKARVNLLNYKVSKVRNFHNPAHDNFINKSLEEVNNLSTKRGAAVFKVKDMLKTSTSVTEGFKDGVKELNFESVGSALKIAGLVADTTSRGINVYDDYKEYGAGIATSTTVLTLIDETADFLNPLGFVSAITGLTIDEKPVTEWNGLSDQVLQRLKIVAEYDLADFVRKPAELIKTLENEDQAHMAYLDAVDVAWQKISKDGVLGYQNKMKKLMAIDDPDKFLAEAKILQQDHMREIDGLIKGLQGFVGTMADNVTGSFLHDSQDKYVAMQDRANTLINFLNKYKAENKSVTVPSDVVDAWMLKQVLQAKIDIEVNDAKLLMATGKIIDDIKEKSAQSAIIKQPVIDKSILSTSLSCVGQVGNSINGCIALNPGTNPVIKVQAQDSTNLNNAKIKTGYEQTALAQNTQNYDVLQDWTVTEGDQAKHFSIGNSFGSITAPDPNKPTIAALNNADMQETTMTKVYKVPTGVKQVNVGMLANFVTNEYPQFVGTQFNDKGTIEIKTGSGNVYQATLYNKELNSANFTPVSGLPSPMYSTGGQTGFDAVNKTINVANGGNLTITVKTMNVGDMAVPSATLINSTSVK